MHIHFIYEELGAATRYRIHHHAEQARMGGMQTRVFPATRRNLLTTLSGCDLVYLHRLRLTSITLPLLLAARLRRIPLVYDSDDLVWDQAEREYNQLDRYYPPETVALLLAENRRRELLMRRADVLVLATPYLAERARRELRRPVFVHPNVLSEQMVADSHAAAAQPRSTPPGIVRIGYFSGTRHAHDDDFAAITPALALILERFPAVQLRIHGELELRGALTEARYAARIERVPFVPWRELPFFIAQVDINLAPLIDNPQRRSKSAVKYLEAAAVGVPTVAADLEPFAPIRNGETGILAYTEAEWIAGLSRLIEDPEARRRIGAAAQAETLQKHTTAARAAEFHAMIRAIKNREWKN